MCLRGPRFYKLCPLPPRYRKLDVGNSGFLQREDLLRIPELAINPLGDRIIHAFFFGKEDNLDFQVVRGFNDHENGDFLLLFLPHLVQDFVKVLAFFRPVSKNNAKNKMNTKRDKLLFSFRMYDLDGDGAITVVRKTPGDTT